MNATAPTKRKNEISYLNVLFAMLVIFIHVSADPISRLDKASWQYAVVFFPWRMSAFVVQGFIFLSAMKLFIGGREKVDYKRFYLTRITRIVIPYLIWNVIYFIYFVNKGYFGFELWRLGRYITNGTLVSPFYFIITIIQFYALYPLSRVMVKKIDPVYMLVFSAVITHFLGQYLPQIIAVIAPEFSFKYNDRIFTTYLFYWVAGCYAGADYEGFKASLKKNRTFISVCFVVFAAAEGLLSYLAFTGIKYIPWLESIHYCYVISTIIFLFMLAAALAERNNWMPRLLSLTDKVSYGIFLAHCLAINLINDRMAEAGLTDITATYLIRIVVVYVSTVALCILWSALRRRIGNAVGQLKQRR